MILITTIFLLLFSGIALVGIYLIREGWQFGFLDGLAGMVIGSAALLTGAFGFAAIVIFSL